MSDPGPFIPVAAPDLSGNELAYVTDCVRSGWVSSLGRYVQSFESEFAAFCGVRHAVAVCNGTAALHLALAVLDVGPGDEVIVPTLTFIATANAVHYTGARPVFADSEAVTWNIDPAAIPGRMSARTRVILPVHLYGHPAHLQPILQHAARVGVAVVEDAAEAHGALYGGRKVGSFGRINTFSFYGNKILTTGEGGMLTTDDDELAAKARQLRDHGMSPDRRYWHPIIGFNYRMTNLQAALGLAQLERVDQFIQRKRALADQYRSLLGGVPGIVTAPEAQWARSVYWLYSVLVTEEFPLTRDDLIGYLREQEIDSRPFFHPIHQMPPYSTGESLPVAERLAQQGINLPSGVGLKDEDVERVAEAIRRCR
jgi:perosamine synthetase